MKCKLVIVMSVAITALLLCGITLSVSQAQEPEKPYLVKDIYPYSKSSNPRSLITINKDLFFVAEFYSDSDERVYDALWVSKGTSAEPIALVYAYKSQSWQWIIHSLTAVNDTQ